MMPIYAYECECGKVREVLTTSAKRRRSVMCDCGKLAFRSMAKEGVAVVGDIEPHYDMSLGQHVSSRADKRDALKIMNAYDPTMERGGSLSGGITSDERYDMLQKGKTDIFEKRGMAGWGKPSDPNKDIVVEGTANYDENKSAIRASHAKSLQAKGRGDLATKLMNRKG